MTSLKYRMTSTNYKSTLSKVYRNLRTKYDLLKSYMENIPESLKDDELYSIHALKLEHSKYTVSIVGHLHNNNRTLAMESFQKLKHLTINIMDGLLFDGKTIPIMNEERNQLEPGNEEGTRLECKKFKRENDIYQDMFDKGDMIPNYWKKE